MFVDNTVEEYLGLAPVPFGHTCPDIVIGNVDDFVDGDLVESEAEGADWAETDDDLPEVDNDLPEVDNDLADVDDDDLAEDDDFAEADDDDFAEADEDDDAAEAADVDLFTGVVVLIFIILKTKQTCW